MPDTIRERIIAAVERRLQQITTANGHETDLGANVQRAALYFPMPDLPAVSLLPGVEESERSYGVQHHTMPLEVKGFLAHGSDNPSVVAEKGLADLIRAVLERPEETLPGEPEEPGGGEGDPPPEEPPQAEDLFSLVDDIEYKGGGVDEYPDGPDTSTCVTAVFQVKYRTQIGNPYAQ